MPKSIRLDGLFNMVKLVFSDIIYGVVYLKKQENIQYVGGSMVKDDLQNLLKNISLTATQRERAEELYTNLCQAIQEFGFDIDFYPQGSFATKTAVKPFRDSKDQSYDVDVICQFKGYNKARTTPKELMHDLSIIMKLICSEKGKEYRECERCITIDYADKDGISFSIDVIPAIAESSAEINSLISLSERGDLVNSSIAIGTNNESLGWITNNPKGYIQWFNEVTINFENISFEERGIFKDTVEDLPDDNLPSNQLRNTIKILKRLRDVYYSRIKAKSTSPSIIITTIVGKLAPTLTSYRNEWTMLEAIVHQLHTMYLLYSDDKRNSDIYGLENISKVVTRQHGEWVLMNPANGKDNVLSSWNDGSSTAAEDFFGWIEDLNNLIQQLSKSRSNMIDYRTLWSSNLNLKESIGEGGLVSDQTTVSKPWKETN